MWIELGKLIKTKVRDGENHGSRTVGYPSSINDTETVKKSPKRTRSHNTGTKLKFKDGNKCTK